MLGTGRHLNAVIIFGILALLLLSRGLPAGANGLSSSTCAPSVLDQQVQAIHGTLNEATANATAIPVLAGYNSMYTGIHYDSTFYSYSWNSNCNLSLKDVSVDFDMRALNGSSYTLEVAVSPNLASVLNSMVYLSLTHSGNLNPTGKYGWSGYEYSPTNGDQVEQNGAYWDVPYVDGAGYDGSTNNCDQSSHNYECDISFWVGETYCQGGNQSLSGCNGAGYLAQTGTDSYCKFTCTSNYKANYWYEWYPTANQNVCGGTQYGDEVAGEVEKASSTEYYVTVDDYTLSIGCSSYSPSGFDLSSWGSYYAQFMAETPGNTALPGFYGLSPWDGYYYDSANNYYGIDNNWNTADYTDLTSTTTSCLGTTIHVNVCPSSVSSQSFTETLEATDGY